MIDAELPRVLERVDAVVECPELGLELAEELGALAPFGRGNPPVCLMIEGARFRDPRPMGEGKHLRFTVESAGARARCVRFGEGTALPVAEGEAARATFALEVNEWNGVVEPRLRLRQAVAAEPPASGAGAPPRERAPVGARRGGGDRDRRSPSPEAGEAAGEQLALL